VRSIATAAAHYQAVKLNAMKLFLILLLAVFDLRGGAAHSFSLDLRWPWVSFDLPEWAQTWSQACVSPRSGTCIGQVPSCYAGRTRALGLSPCPAQDCRSSTMQWQLNDWRKQLECASSRMLTNSNSAGAYTAVPCLRHT
jgi:hypothetical protein